MTNSTEKSFQLAQFNYARAKFPPEDPRMKNFIDGLDSINALSDRSEGFIWRLKTDAGHSINIRPFKDDEKKLVTLSVWRDIESLKRFVYQSDHMNFLCKRDDWFESSSDPFLVLWWHEKNNVPTILESLKRLEYLQLNGPTPYAFDFRSPFNPNGTPFSSSPKSSCPFEKLMNWRRKK